jgi:hypothetical protein
MVHYRAHKNLPTVLILPSTSRWPLSFRFSYQNCECTYLLCNAYYILCPSHLSMVLQPFVGSWPIFLFLNPYTFLRTPLTGDQPFTRPLPTHKIAQTHNKRTQISMPRMGFERRSQCSNERREFLP